MAIDPKRRRLLKRAQAKALKEVREEISKVVTDLVHREIGVGSPEGKRLEELFIVEKAVTQVPEGEA